jgi:hypothetical protein
MIGRLAGGLGMIGGLGMSKKKNYNNIAKQNADARQQNNAGVCHG